jgi:hypothetical protein
VKFNTIKNLIPHPKIHTIKEFSKYGYMLLLIQTGFGFFLNGCTNLHDCSKWYNIISVDSKFYPSVSNVSAFFYRRLGRLGHRASPPAQDPTP